ncbi:MAG: hypothetical protein GKR89_26280 [Candidatus Latescibacteria bacterium]|nr:hypothetical protein [Candidatus Latescibacterota bacterium]
MAAPQTAFSRAHTTKRTALQLVGGTYFGSMAGMLVILLSGQALGCGCPQGQNDDALDRLDRPFITLGAPTAFTLANSIAVTVIGKRLDKRHSGRYLPTLAGSIAGAALGAGLVGGLHHSTGNFPAGAFAGSLFLPPLGAILGYNWSTPSSLLSSTGPQRRWSLPVPALRLVQGPEDDAGVGITLPLFHAAL